jgi:hypothetical protein
MLIMRIYNALSSQLLKQLVFSTETETLSIPVIPLFWNVMLNSSVAFWPQILSGFVAKKKKQIN